MAEQTEPKKRGRKKGSTGIPRKTTAKRVPRNLESMSFEQLQELNVRISELMKNKKDEQIKLLKTRLAELEKL